MKSLTTFIQEAGSDIIQVIKSVGKIDFSEITGTRSTDIAFNQEKYWCEKFNNITNKYIAKTSKEAITNWTKEIDAESGDIYIYEGSKIIFYIDLKVSDTKNKNKLGTITLKSLSEFSKNNTDKKMYLCCALDGSQNPVYVNPKALYDILTDENNPQGKEIEICNTKHPAKQGNKELTYIIQGVKYNIQSYIKGTEKGYNRKGFNILY